MARKVLITALLLVGLAAIATAVPSTFTVVDGVEIPEGAVFTDATIPEGTVLEVKSPMDPKETCVISSIDGETTHRVKNCTACTMHCLTMAECEFALWGEWDEPLPRMHLVNTSCEVEEELPYNEELCVLLAGDEWILDASHKQCDDCVKACNTRFECQAMAWNFTVIDREDLQQFAESCPPHVEPPKPSPRPLPSPAKATPRMAVRLDDDEEMVAPAPGPMEWAEDDRNIEEENE